MNLTALKKMIQIPSTFPHEGELGEFVYQQLEASGCRVEKHYISEHRFNVLAEKGIGEKALMFYGHLDTVPLYGEWDSDPYTLTERGDRLFGLGATDMKGGIFTILEAIKDCPIPDGKKLKIALCVDEENESEGAYSLSKHSFLKDVQLIVSAEGCEGNMPEAGTKIMFLGRRGRVGINISVPGISAHGAYPEQGINAVLEAYKVIAALDKMPIPQHDRLGSGCQFIQEISARSGSLSVPERCDIYLSRHLVPPETPTSTLNTVREFIESLYSKGTLKPLNGRKAEVSFAKRKMPFYIPYLTDANNPLVKQLVESLESRHVQHVHLSYGKAVADENIFGGINQIPTIVLGPDGANLHSANEWVSKRSLEQTIMIYRDIIQSLDL